MNRSVMGIGSRIGAVVLWLGAAVTVPAQTFSFYPLPASYGQPK